MSDDMTWWDTRHALTELAETTFASWRKGLSEQARSAIGDNDARRAEDLLVYAMLEFIGYREGRDPVSGEPLPEDDEATT